ncbi:PfkB family carbohydrate kinase, partial [Cellulosimicrobium cellulans]|uniref:PfkB family carbohydrate kinase n=1 Tax=Cellulosimicrobium cellulans TaxID=1710 RepID=UPI00319E056D
LGARDEPVGTDAVLAMVRALDHPGDVVVTLGADGALVVPAGGAPVTVPAERVDAVDTTAAGDSFCAALADGLLHGGDLVESARWAARVAASTTTRHGAVDSLPRATDLAPEGTRIPLHS